MLSELHWFCPNPGCTSLSELGSLALHTHSTGQWFSKTTLFLVQMDET